MKITGPGKSAAPAARRTQKKSESSSAGFAASIERTGGASAGAPAVGVGPVAAVEALLSLQEAPDGAQARSKGLERARDMLALLEEVRRGILLGVIPRAKLEQLARLARARDDRFEDPELRSILDDIELRAEVELAKFEARD